MNLPCFGYITAPNFTESREWVCILMNISEEDWDGRKSWGNWWGLFLHNHQTQTSRFSITAISYSDNSAM